MHSNNFHDYPTVVKNMDMTFTSSGNLICRRTPWDWNKHLHFTTTYADSRHANRWKIRKAVWLLPANLLMCHLASCCFELSQIIRLFQNLTVWSLALKWFSLKYFLLVKNMGLTKELSLETYRFSYSSKLKFEFLMAYASQSQN